MAQTVLRVKIRMPWWWRPAMYGFIGFHVVRAWLGWKVDEDRESARFMSLIARQIRVTPMAD